MKKNDYNGKDASVLQAKKLFLLDIDGTVCLGEKLFDGVREFLKNIEKHGGRYIFITNNSSKSVDAYVEKMHRLGLKNITAEHFFTSAQAAVALMKEKFPYGLIYLQGTESFEAECRNNGLRITTEYTNEASVILVGFDPEFTGEKVMTTCKMLTKHALPYYATNPDWVCPVEFGYIPDCGAMCQSYEHATGKLPVFIGKPQPTMIFSAMRKVGVSSEDTVVIGDRLYTDIVAGNKAGVDTVCVLSGEATLDDIEQAKNDEKPTFVFDHIKNIF